LEKHYYKSAVVRFITYIPTTHSSLSV